MDKIVPMSERVYQKIRVDEIRVLNKRNRNEEQFKENVESIESRGLLKPVVVNERNRKSKGYYELVCGEGRLTAFKRLNKSHIPAEVINVDNKTAMLYSLVENIARLTPGSIWFAKELLRLHKNGMSYTKIGKLIGKSSQYVKTYITLMEKGEERLINGVEKRWFPVQFAYQVSLANSKSVQHLLMDAFDSGLINGSNTSKIRQLIEQRFTQGQKRAREITYKFTVDELKNEIKSAVEETEAYTHQMKLKENRLVMLIQYLEDLSHDQNFVSLLKKYKLDYFPELTGGYSLRLKEEMQ